MSEQLAEPGPAWDSFEGLIRAYSRRYNAALELACEMALQTGVCGVLVTYGPESELLSMNLTRSITFELSSDVPYGTIMERYLP